MNPTTRVWRLTSCAVEDAADAGEAPADYFGPAAEVAPHPTPSAKQSSPAPSHRPESIQVYTYAVAPLRRRRRIPALYRTGMLRAGRRRRSRVSLASEAEAGGAGRQVPAEGQHLRGAAVAYRASGDLAAILPGAAVDPHRTDDQRRITSDSPLVDLAAPRRRGRLLL